MCVRGVEKGGVGPRRAWGLGRGATPLPVFYFLLERDVTNCEYDLNWYFGSFCGPCLRGVWGLPPTQIIRETFRS